MDGVVNVHKTAGPTSHDVVDQVRGIFGQKRVGHAGTLDPMATGVLVVCLGKATRIVEYLLGAEKEYRATMTLGFSTDTQDSTGAVIGESDASRVTLADFEAVAKQFVGEIEQVPPMISALKHEGKPLYKHAREGTTIERAARKVSFYSIDVVDFRAGGRAEADLVVTCSSGTYIRTLCADIGEALGCGGMMSRLERTRVGRFSIEGAVTTEQLEYAQSQGRLEEYVESVADALADMPAVEVDAQGQWRILHGLSVTAGTDLELGSTVKVLSNGELIAIGIAEGDLVKPRKVLAESNE